eukprot:TRINITY_DN2788_c0_g1_i1.p1 TRINITY_DN2788_c0_g1~~TRINITY_DN2788_c0_g1_i1.p1  ORF type:complete len:275 (-),score=61.26 TRINITY_DN2788_c0_g1_i1:272-1096(-)
MLPSSRIPCAFKHFSFHQRLSHQSFELLLKMDAKGKVEGFSKLLSTMDTNGKVEGSLQNGSNGVKEHPADTAPRKYKIYTKTGDGGMSSLYTMERRRKDDAVFDALGDVDELNSVLGVAHQFCLQSGKVEICTQLEEIQSRLLDVGSAVATPAGSASVHKLNRARFPEGEVEKLESWIDSLDESLTPLKNFILPSGGLAASFLHMARTICRRAERRVIRLADGDQVEDKVVHYLNRLSDYLFTAARFAAKEENMPETVYKKAPPAKKTEPEVTN